MTAPVRAVLFDMDGVLVFSEDAWFLVYNETLEGFGHAPISRAEFDAIYGNGTEADRAMYMPERSCAEIDAAYERLFRTRLEAVRPNHEALEAIGVLRGRGLSTAVATNTNRPLAERILSVAGYAGCFDAICCADEAGAGKPDPAVLHLAARRLGVPLAECLFVGDSRYDAGAAAAAPVRFVGYRLTAVERVDSLLELASLPGLLAPAAVEVS